MITWLKSRACPQLRDRSATSAVGVRLAAEEDRPMRRYALRDDQWERIRDLLPGREGYVGVTAKDNRLFVEAVLYRCRAGIPWRDLPERFGDWKKVHTRFCRWAKTGVWERIFRHLAGEADNEYHKAPLLHFRHQVATDACLTSSVTR